MAEVGRFAVSVSVSGDELIPEQISQLLGATPTTCYRKGGEWLTPNGRALVGRTGLWILRHGQHDTTDLNALIDGLLARLTDDQAVWEELTAQFEVRLFCGVFLGQWNEGFALSPQTMKALGTRKILFEADVYSGSDEELCSD